MLASGADLAGADLALASASHSGEPMHVERALAMLARAGLTEDDLGCPPALPMDEADKLAVLAAGGGPRRIYMNCSGKHAGMLTACVAQGWPTVGYLSPDHPLQLRVARRGHPAVRRGTVRGRDRRLRRPAVRHLADRAGPGLRRGQRGRRRARWSAGGRRHAGPPGDGRRHRPRGHQVDAGDPGPAGQGRRRGRALRRAAGRSLRRGQDHRWRRPGQDAGAGRRAALAGRGRRATPRQPRCWTNWEPGSCSAAATRSAPSQAAPDLF